MQPGDLAPDFTLTDQEGRSVSLTDSLTYGPVVLFFYPAAMTTGCTRETCHFRDLKAEFSARGATLLGISMDDVARQSKFASTNRIDFPLLSDADGSVARLYGVKRGLALLRVRRTTFVIDTDRRILDAIHSEIYMDRHADRALEVLSAR